MTKKSTLQKFEKFYDSLENKTDIFYMFFTTGLLFWAVKSLSLIKNYVNIVVICSSLDEEEIKWMKKNIKNPTYFMDTLCSDGIILDLLFKVNKNNFGWIDADCFILDPTVFYKISQIKKNVSINCLWSYKDDNCLIKDKCFLNTYFYFLNIEAIKAVQSTNIKITPHLYYYDKKDEGNKNDVFITEKPQIQLTKQQLKIIKNYFREGEFPNHHNTDAKFFDTLIAYQLIADYNGYSINSLYSDIGYFCNEAIHIGGAHLFSNEQFSRIPKTNISEKFILYYSAAYYILNQSIDILPSKYKCVLYMLEKTINHVGILCEDIEKLLLQYLKNNGYNKKIFNDFFNKPNYENNN